MEAFEQIHMEAIEDEPEGEEGLMDDYRVGDHDCAAHIEPSHAIQSSIQSCILVRNGRISDVILLCHELSDACSRSGVWPT